MCNCGNCYECNYGPTEKIECNQPCGEDCPGIIIEATVRPEASGEAIGKCPVCGRLSMID